MMPLFPIMVRYLDVRLAIGIGLVLYAASCFLDTNLTPDSAGTDFIWAQVLRGFGQYFTLIFLNQSATSSVPPEKAEDASGLFNAARNLGGSIALAVVSTLQERRTTLHVDRISEAVTANSVRVQEAMSQFGGGADDPQRAISSFGQLIRLQATVITFSDLFFVFGVILVLTIPLVLFLRPLPKNAGASLA